METQQSGGDNEGVREDTASTGDEGTRAAQASPAIGQEGRPGQTQTKAPADEAGIPSDEEMNEPSS